jgi:hypothetical protein
MRNLDDIAYGLIKAWNKHVRPGIKKKRFQDFEDLKTEIAKLCMEVQLEVRKSLGLDSSGRFVEKTTEEIPEQSIMETLEADFEKLTRNRDYESAKVVLTLLVQYRLFKKGR